MSARHLAMTSGRGVAMGELGAHLAVAVLSFLAGIVFVFWFMKRPSFADAFIRGALLNQGPHYLRRLEEAD